MKKFEIWWQEKYHRLDINNCVEHTVAKDAWKTVLEWALSEGYRADGQCSLESIIEKELEND